MKLRSDHSVAGTRPAVLADIVRGVLIGGVVLAVTLPPISWALRRVHPPSAAQLAVAATPKVGIARDADFGPTVPQAAVKQVADWVARSADNQSLPFAILDKVDARVYVFDAAARLIDTSPVLLGGAVGDESVAGIGNRPIADVKPEERTTPAGRFVSRPGRNAGGEQVVWVDYEASVSMHRVRISDPKEHRLERLASPSPADNRISYGCINVPVAFFDSVVQPVLARGPAVVYVLPETRALADVFALQGTSRTAKL